MERQDGEYGHGGEREKKSQTAPGRRFGFVVDRLPDPVQQLGQELGLTKVVAGRWRRALGSFEGCFVAPPPEYAMSIKWAGWGWVPPCPAGADPNHR